MSDEKPEDNKPAAFDFPKPEGRLSPLMSVAFTASMLHQRALAREKAERNKPPEGWVDLSPKKPPTP